MAMPWPYYKKADPLLNGQDYDAAAGQFLQAGVSLLQDVLAVSPPLPVLFFFSEVLQPELLYPSLYQPPPLR
jgi:hypothetical protein